MSKPLTLDAKTIAEIEKDPVKYTEKLPTTKLVNMMRTFAHHYYNTDNPLVSDETYDKLYDILEKKDPKNKFLKEVGAPISKDMVSLPYPMASLNKVKPDTGALDDWKKSFKGPYILSDKLDGVSGLLYKHDNKFRLFTRGETTTGQDITHLIPYVLNNRYNPDLIPNNTAIRGELIISKANFATIKEQFKNARNTVSGLVNAKHFSIPVANLTDFIGYAVIHPLLKQETQMLKLQEWKFPCVEYKKVNKPEELTEEMLKTYFKDRRANGPYDVDGIVVADSESVEKSGESNPTYGFAFKMVLTDQVADVKVKNVVWDISMHGYLKPTIQLEPVELGGVTISSVTAFNGKYIESNNIGPGTVLKLVRSGDVIPHILSVVTPTKAQMPDIPYVWNKTNVDLVVKDLHGSAKDNITIKQLDHFFKTMGIKNISIGLITKLVEAGYKTLKDILTSQPSDLAKIDGVGEKIATKVFENTRIAFETTNLETLMAASLIFGQGFGVRKNTVVINAYPNILNEKWTVEECKNKLLLLDGFDELTATQYSAQLPKFKDFFNNLKEIKLISVSHLEYNPNKQTVKKEVKGIFSNISVSFTGFRDKDLEAHIVANGGTVDDGVKKTTTILVYTKESASYEKAKKNNIQTMTRDEFNKKYDYKPKK